MFHFILSLALLCSAINANYTVRTINNKVKEIEYQEKAIKNLVHFYNTP